MIESAWRFDKSKLKAFDILATCLLASACVLPSIAAETIQKPEDWRTESQKGYLQLDSHNPAAAYQNYKKSLSLLNQPESDPVTLDLKLDLAQAAILTKRFNEAHSLLQEVQPLILRNHSGELLEARFWRRCRDLHNEQNDLVNAMRDQQHVVAVVETALPNDCPDSMIEKLNLLKYCAKGKQWESGFRGCADIERSMKLCTESEKRSYKMWIDGFVMFFHQFFTQTYSKEPDLALRLLDTFHQCLPENPVPINLWRFICANQKIPLKQRTQARDKAIATLLLQGDKASNEDKQSLAGLLLSRVLLDVLADSPTSTAAKHDLETASRLVDQVIKPEARDSSILYMHIKSLVSYSLAKAGDPDSANKLLDSLNPSSTTFKTLKPFLGILQARLKTAKQYHAAGKDQLARKQFQEIYRFIESIAGPETQDWLRQLHAQENWCFSKERKPLCE